MIKASNIKIFRQALTISQADLAKILGISRPLLNMVEYSRRAVPPEVDKRIAWSETVLKDAAKAFEKSKSKQILGNKFSMQFAWKAFKSKKTELENAELMLDILLRENADYTRKIYLLNKLRPTPGLKPAELKVFDAWKKYQIRRAEENMEKAGPEIILRTQMQIAALIAEIHCLEEHLNLNAAPGVTHKTEAKTRKKNLKH